MSAPMKRPHIKQIKQTEKKRNTISWREASKEDIEKYTQPGLMLRGARFKEGMTQKELAEKLGVLHHHISEMEHGKRPISKKMADKLGEIFKVNYRIFL